MKKFGKLACLLMTVMMLVVSAFAFTGCQATDGKDGANGLSAYDIWKGLEGNENKTLEDYMAEIVNPVHNYGTEYTVIQMETDVEGGYGFIKCTDDGCNHAQLVYKNAVGCAELNITDTDATALTFTSVMETEMPDSENPGEYITTNGSAAYISVTVAEPGDYDITLTGLPAGMVLLQEDGNYYTEPAMGEAVGGECVLTVSLTNETTKFMVGVMGRISDSPANVEASVGEHELPTLALGLNEINCPSGTKYIFTATEAGQYSFAFDENAGYVSIIDETGSTALYNNDTVTLEANGTVVLLLEDASWPPAATADFDLTIALVPAA